jgi:hypothetical protein
MAGRQKTVKKTEEPKGVAEPGKRSAKAPARAPVSASAKAPRKAEEGRAVVVRKLLKKLEKQMGGGEMKASLGDYIRLVQLHKELDEESPREIKVTWVDPTGEKLGNDSEKKESGGEE